MAWHIIENNVHKALVAYSAMSACMLVVILLTLLCRYIYETVSNRVPECLAENE